MMHKPYLIPVFVALFPFALAGCPDDTPLPLGGTCVSDAQCASGLCLERTCLDPEADDDNDGLLNRVEGALGTNPLVADTDGDGVADGDEVGDVAAPLDSDGDGKLDAQESSLADADGDCIPDQADPDDAQKETDPATLGAKICVKRGVCGGDDAVVTATCQLVDDAPVFTCDYSQIATWQADETLCDRLDNDCDGDTDEAFAAGGTVTFDGGPFAGDAGKALGASCGAGACAGGVVICDPGDATALTCSTLANAAAERCDASDDDCDGETDEGGPDLPGCTPFFHDDDGDLWGGAEAACLCAPDTYYTRADGGDCADDRDDIHPDADAICGEDADCAGGLVDAGEPCDDGNDDPLDGCDTCTPAPWAVATAPATGYIVDHAVAALSEGWVTLWAEVSDNNTTLHGTVHGVPGAPLPVPDVYAGDQFPGSPRVAALSGGGFVVVWTHGEGGLHAQRFDGLGAPAGARRELGGDPVTLDMAVAPLPGDRFAVAWSSYATQFQAVRVRAFEADGTPVGDAFTPHDASAWGQEPSVVALPAGAVITWVDNDPDTYVRVPSLRWLDGDGNAQGPVRTVPLVGDERLDTFRVAPAAGGGIWAVVSVSTYTANQYSQRVFAQRMGADGATVGDRVVLESDSGKITSWNMQAAALPDGTLTVVWGDSSEIQVPLRAFIVPPEGGAVTSLPLQDVSRVPSVAAPAVTAGADWFGVLYQGRLADQGPARLLLRRYDRDGALLYH